MRPSWRIFPAWLAGGIAESPEEIRAHAARDRAPGILGHHQALERFGGIGPRGGQVHGRPQRDHPRVHGDRALAGEGNAECPDGPRQVVRELAEEDVARIGIEEPPHPARMPPRPFLDALHRCVLQRDLAAVDEHAPQGAERLPVLVGVAHPKPLAVRQLHLAGALDVQEEELDRVIDPCDLGALERGGRLVDVAAREVGNDAAAFEAPPQAPVLEIGVDRGQVDREQVLGHAVDRVAIARRARAASAQQRLVVAGDEAGVGVVRVHHAIGIEIHLEEQGDLALPGRGLQGVGPGAHRLPGRLLVEHGTTARKRLERGAQRVARASRATRSTMPARACPAVFGRRRRRRAWEWARECGEGGQTGFSAGGHARGAGATTRGCGSAQPQSIAARSAAQAPGPMDDNGRDARLIEEVDVGWVFLEIVAALGVAVAIVWWTFPKKPKGDATKGAGGRSEGGER